MAKDDTNPVFTAEELGYSNLASINAIVRVLEKKGFLTHEEVLEEIENIKQEMENKRLSN